jgi:hypothetical protein
MTGATHVGEYVQLPSGLGVLITVAGDPAWPWQPVNIGTAWQVGRTDHLNLRTRGARAFYSGGRRMPIQLGETDAKALAEILNRALPVAAP